MAKRALKSSKDNGAKVNVDNMVANSLAMINNDFTSQMRTINSTLLSRAQLSKSWMDPRRNIDDECGYPQGFSVGQFKEMYDRESIAARVVEVLPQETWKITPHIYETESLEDETEFEKDWKDLSTSLSVGPDDEDDESYFTDEKANPIWELLSRADKLSGIGHFGLIFLGVDDGLSLDQPIQFGSRKHKLLFIRVIDESLITINKSESDRTNKRYGRPISYNITFNDPTLSQGVSTVDVQNQEVHWTRVIHVADNLDSSEVFGVPRQRPVFKRLMDLAKLYGGSAEMYWKGAFPGISLETHPELGGDVDLPSDIKEQIENYQNGLQRMLAIAGTTAKSLAPQVVDPSAQIDVQLDAICIKLGMPKRIFMGSERGKLASTQDDTTWKERIKGRRLNYVTPRIIVPFINRLIALGVLSKPKDKFKLKWSDVDVLDPAKKSEISLRRTDAMTKYVSGNVQKVIKLEDWLSKEMGYSNDEAMEIVSRREEDPMLKPDVPVGGFIDGSKQPGIPADKGKDKIRVPENSGRMVGEGET